MCNRFTLKSPERVGLWSREWMEWEFNEFIQRYNVVPTNRVKIGRRREGKAEFTEMQWGAKGFDGKLQTIARADRAFSTHAKRIQERRCVVPADGFYEWQAVSKKESLPYHFQLRGEQPFCMAGIYSSNGGFLILTTDPNEVVSRIHVRMPVILDKMATVRWLQDGLISKEEIEVIARPFPADQMEAIAVSKYVSNWRNEGPRCIEPASQAELITEKENGEQLKLF